MKTKLLLTSLLLAGWGLSASAQETVKLKCVGDTWVRNAGGQTGTTRGSEGTVQIKGGANIYGLFGFERGNVSPDLQVGKATLHIITSVKKGGTATIYPYVDFDETTACYNTEKDKIDITAAPTVTWSFIGEDGDDIQKKTRTSLDLWTNDIDVTDIVAKLYAGKTENINFMIINEGDPDTRLVSKDTDITVNLSDGTEITSEQLVPYLEVTFVEQSDIVSKAINPSADTFVRSNAPSNTYGSQGDMEIYWLEGDNNTYFAGLMKFNLPSELTSGAYELTDASLRLVSVQNKSNRVLKLYPFVDFKENSSWNDVSEAVLASLKNDIFASFEVKGQGNKNIAADTDITDEYASIANWTNYINVTKHVQGLLNENNSVFSFLMEKEVAGNNAIRIATKEAGEIKVYGEEIEDIEGYEGEYLTKNVKVDGVDVTKYYKVKATISSEDLVPQLTITYRKVFVPEFSHGNNDTTLPSPDEDGTLNITTSNENGDAAINITAPEGTTHVYYKRVADGKNNIKALAADDDDSYLNDGYTRATPNGDGTHTIALNEGPTGGKSSIEIKFVKKSEETTEELGSHTLNYNIKVSSDPSAVSAIEAENGVVEFFNLQGVKVANPDKGSVLIKVQGGKASKVIL